MQDPSRHASCNYDRLVLHCALAQEHRPAARSGPIPAPRRLVDIIANSQSLPVGELALATCCVAMDPTSLLLGTWHSDDDAFVYFCAHTQLVIHRPGNLPDEFAPPTLCNDGRRLVLLEWNAATWSPPMDGEAPDVVELRCFSPRKDITLQRITHASACPMGVWLREIHDTYRAMNANPDTRSASRHAMDMMIQLSALIGVLFYPHPTDGCVSGEVLHSLVLDLPPHPACNEQQYQSVCRADPQHFRSIRTRLFSILLIGTTAIGKERGNSNPSGEVSLHSPQQTVATTHVACYDHNHRSTSIPSHDPPNGMNRNIDALNATLPTTILLGDEHNPGPWVYQDCTETPRHKVRVYQNRIEHKLVAELFDGTSRPPPIKAHPRAFRQLVLFPGIPTFTPSFAFEIHTWGLKAAIDPRTMTFPVMIDARDLNAFTGVNWNGNDIRVRGSGIQFSRQTCIVCDQAAFRPLMSATIRAIEMRRPAAVGIYCKAGHHRSVGFAEILRRYVYQQAVILHHCLEDPYGEYGR